MKNTPGWVIWVCSTIMLLTFTLGFFYLAINGIDDTQFRSYFNTMVNFLTLILSGGAFLTSAATQRQTNGQLENRLKETVVPAVVDAVRENGNANNV